MNTMVSIAVIDTGIYAAQLSYASVLPGVNFSGEGATDDAADPHGHGTAVAATIVQIATQARLVPIRIMDRRGVLRNAAALEAAFDWILEHHGALGIRIVCAAFSDASHATSDSAYHGSRLQQHIAALREAGVATVAAAGGWYPEHRASAPQGMAWPAILREAVSVGAVERRGDGFWLTHTTQRLHAGLGTGCHTTVFTEPGAPGDTSGAAAVVVGCLAALRSRYPHAPVDALLQMLLRHQQLGQDEHGLAWPAVDVNEVLRGS